jgi:hypothetical protein
MPYQLVARYYYYEEDAFEVEVLVVAFASVMKKIIKNDIVKLIIKLEKIAVLANFSLV